MTHTPDKIFPAGMEDIFERITDAFVALDKNWCYTYMNKKAGEIFKRNPKDIIGKHIWTEFPEEIDHTFYKAYHRAMAEQQYIHVEEYSPLYDTWFESHIYPSPEGLSIYFRDITERKKTEEKLRKSEEKFYITFHSSPDSITVSTIASGQILEVNKSFTKMFGFTREEVLGKTAVELGIIKNVKLRNESLSELGKGGAFKNKETILWNKEDEQTIVSISTEIITWNNEECVLSVQRDITERKKGEEEIKAREENYRTLLEQASDAIVITDLEGNIIQVNAAASQMTGYNRQELLSLTTRDLVNEKELDEQRKIFEELKTGKTVLTERNWKRKDGSILKVEMSAKMLPDGRMQKIFRDITERKVAEEKLRESEEKFATIFKAAPGSIILSSLPDGRMVEVNDNFSVITGYSKDEAMGKTTVQLDIWTDLLKRDRFLSLLQANGVVRDFEADLNHKSGAIRNGLVSGHIITIAAKKYLLGVFYDITERKKAEAELKKNELRFQAMVENDVSSIALFDKDLKLVYRSPSAQRIVGWTNEELQQHGPFDKLHPDDVEKAKIDFAEVLKNPGKPIKTSTRILHKNGSYVFMEGVVTNLLANENVNAIVFNVQDITERKKSEQHKNIFANMGKVLSYATTAKEAGKVLMEAADQLFGWDSCTMELISASGSLQKNILLIDIINGKRTEITDSTQEQPISDLRKKVVAEGALLINNPGDTHLPGVTPFGNINRPSLSLMYVPIYTRGKPIGVMSIQSYTLNAYTNADLETFQSIAEYCGDALERINTGAALAISEKNYRNLFEQNLAGIYLITIEGQILNCNNALASLLGYPSIEELQSINATELYFSKVERDNYINRLRQEGEINNFEILLKNRYGQPLYCILSARLYKDPETGQELCGGVIINITDRKKAEEEIRQITGRLSLATSSAKLGIWDWDIVNNKLIWDERMYQLYGIKEKNFTGTIDTWQKGVHPDDIERADKELNDAIQGICEFNIEFRVVWPDKSVHFIEANGLVIRDEIGKALRMIGVNWDITERKKAEKELQHSNFRFEMIGRSTNDALWEWDFETGKLWANQTHQLLYGLTLADPVPTEDLWKERIHPEDRDAIVALQNRNLNSDKNIIISEYRFRNADNEYRNIYDRCYITRNKEENPVSMVGSMMDITELKRAEQSLAERERHLFTILQTEPECIKLLGPNGELLDMNPAGLAMLEADSLQQILKHSLQELVTPQYRTAFAKLIKEVFNGNSGKLEFEVIGLKGAHRWLETNAVPLKNAEGKIISLLGVTRDVTERKKAEEDLHESEERFRALYEENPLMNFTIAADGKILSVNKRGAKQLGYSIQELLGRTVLDLFNKEDHPVVITQLKECLANPNKSFSWSLRKITRSKETIWVSETGTAIKDRHGNSSVLIVCENITGRKKNEEEKLQAEKKYRLLFENNIAGIYRTTFAGEILECNNAMAKFFGFDLADDFKKNNADLLYYNPDDRNKYLKLLKEKRALSNYEITLKRKDGSPIHLLENIVLTESNEHPEGIIEGVSIDITERKKAQDEVEHTSQQLRQLTTHLQTIREEERKRIGREIHDDLGQQLTAIKMDVAWIDKKTTDQSSIIKPKLKNIISLLDSSNESVRKILNELRADILDNYGLVEALEWQGLQFTANTGISVLFSSTEPVIKTEEAIATCIYRAYQEALTNITRYAKAKKVVSSLQYIDEQIILEIKDDGKGFDTVKQMKKQSFGLLGMKERVASLNGTFKLISSPGKGTTIIISLPCKM